MKWICVAVIAGVLSSGCALLKRNSRTSNESRVEQNAALSLKNQTTSTSTKDGKSMFWQQNGIDADYKIRYYPRGQFRMGMDGLLMGEFDSILLTGRQQQLNSTLEKSTVREQDKKELNTNLSQQLRVEQQDKSVQKKSTPDIKIIIGIIILIASAILFMKFRKKHPEKGLGF